MVNAHAAAVEAMARALCRPAHVGPDDAGSCVDCRAKAGRAVVVLVRSDAVREALVEAAEDAVNTLAPGLAGEFDEWRDFFHDAAAHGVDAILAALAGGEAAR